MELFETILHAGIEPVARLFSVNARVFGPYLLGAGLLATLVWAFKLRGKVSLFRFLFPREIWLHRSSLLDLQLIVAKALAFALLLWPLAVSASVLAVKLALLLTRVFGVGPAANASPALALVVFTIAGFFAEDFARYVVHRLAHRVPVLWELHKVHHSAEVLTPLTVYRTHPLESVLMRAGAATGIGAAAGVCAWAFAGRITAWEIVGVHGLSFAWNMLGSNLRHSHVWLSFGRVAEHVLISPAQHQIHHSDDARHHDRNFGSTFALWDWIGGSLYVTRGREKIRFGLPPDQANHHQSVGSALLAPMAAALRLVQRGRRTRAVGAARARALGASALALGLVSANDAVAQGEGEVIEVVATAEPEATPEAAPAAAPAPPPEKKPPPAATVPAGRRSPVAPAMGNAAAAAAEAEADDAMDVVVMGSRAARASGSVQVMNEKKLGRFEHDDPHQILLAAPGVYLRTEDGFGLRPNIGIRGASSDRSKKVTLLEDGILFAPAPYSAPAAYYFPLMTRMASVRVIKGPSSIPYGPQSIGGAVDLRTRYIPTPGAGMVDVGLGSYGYGKLHAWYGTSDERSGLLVEGVHLRSDGFKELDGGGDTGFDRNEWMLKGRYLLDPEAKIPQELRVKLGYSDETSNETYTGLTDADFRKNPLRRYRITAGDQMQWRRTQVELRHIATFSPEVELETVAYRNDLDRVWSRAHGFVGAEFADVLASPTGARRVYYDVMTGAQDSATADENVLAGPNGRRFVSQGIQSTARVRGTTGRVYHSAEYGVRFHQDRTERLQTRDTFRMESGRLRFQPVPKTAATDNEASTQAVAFHATNAMTFARFTATPGVRVELIRWQYEDALTNTKQADGYDVVLPGLGLYQGINDDIGVLAGVYRGFSPAAPGPVRSKPETAWNYEAGMRYAHRQTRLEAIGFFNDYENLTDVCTTSNGCLDVNLDRQFDAGTVHVYGVELFGDHTFKADGFDVPASLAYTYTRSRFTTGFQSEDPLWGDVEEGDELPYVPRHQGQASVGVETSKWGLVTSGTFIDRMRETAGTGEPADEEATDRQFLWDVGGHFVPWKKARVYLNVKNVTNEMYLVSRRPAGARPNAPRSIQLGFKQEF